jgi:hypothetical protein
VEAASDAAVSVLTSSDAALSAAVDSTTGEADSVTAGPSVSGGSGVSRLARTGSEGAGGVFVRCTRRITRYTARKSTRALDRINPAQAIGECFCFGFAVMIRSSFIENLLLHLPQTARRIACVSGNH